MAPMAGGIAYADQQWPVLSFGPLQYLLVPGLAVYRIVGVLEQVGTALVDQCIGVWVFHLPCFGLGISAGAATVETKKASCWGRLDRCSWILLHFKGYFDVHPIIVDLAVLYGGTLFVHIDGTDVLDLFGGLCQCMFCSILPTLVGVCQYFDYF